MKNDESISLGKPLGLGDEGKGGITVPLKF